MRDKVVPPYLRYLLHPWRMWVRTYFLLKIKKRIVLISGLQQKPRAMYDGYVLERRDLIKEQNYLMVYDELFGRWIHINVSPETEFYGTS